MNEPLLIIALDYLQDNGMRGERGGGGGLGKG